MTEHFQFAQPEWLYVLPFILCLIILRRRRGAEGSITYPTVRFISSLARNPQSLAGKIGAILLRAGGGGPRHRAGAPPKSGG